MFIDSEHFTISNTIQLISFCCWWQYYAIVLTILVCIPNITLQKCNWFLHQLSILYSSGEQELYLPIILSREGEGWTVLINVKMRIFVLIKFISLVESDELIAIASCKVIHFDVQTNLTVFTSRTNNISFSGVCVGPAGYWFIIIIRRCMAWPLMYMIKIIYLSLIEIMIYGYLFLLCCCCCMFFIFFFFSFFFIIFNNIQNI